MLFNFTVPNEINHKNQKRSEIEKTVYIMQIVQKIQKGTFIVNQGTMELRTINAIIFHILKENEGR